MRSEYSWVPPHVLATVSAPHQIGVSFTDHRQVVLDKEGRARRIDVRAGMVFATGSQTWTWTEVAEPTEALEIFPDRSLLGKEIEPVTGGSDPVVLGVAATLKRAHVAGREIDDLHASTLAHLLATHLASYYCGSRRPVQAPRGRLDRAQLRRVTDLIEERLGESLRLEDLAEAARLSPFHFARAFRASTGMAPHQFLTMCRMERAKSLLLASKTSVMEVAHRVGFSNLSHFRRTFRSHTGGLPSDLRSA
jgi:AraC family transcriptional regulator